MSLILGPMSVRATVLLAVMVLAACAPAAQPGAAPPSTTAAARTPEVTRLIDAARAANEGELDLMWNPRVLGGLDGAKRFEALFNSMYGTNIKINFTPGPEHFADLATSVSQEVAAGRRPSADVLLANDAVFATLFDGAVLESYDYAKLSPRVTKDIVGPGNIGVQVNTRISGIIYNTALVAKADVPRKVEDLLEPKWKEDRCGQRDGRLGQRRATTRVGR